MQRIIVLQPTRATGVTADYPDGSAKNETAPGANDGTPFEIARDNDVFGLQQALLHQLGITPSGLAETALLSDFLEGVRRLVSRAPFFVASGPVNAYVLTKATDLQVTAALYDGMEIEFKANITNTGATTVNPDTLGATAVTLPDGTALSGGEIVANQYVKARYNLASTRFELPELATVKAGATAWVNFDGVGAASINDSLNVSGVVRDSAGVYTITFAVPLANVNYAWVGGVRDSDASVGGSGRNVVAFSTGTKTVNAIQIRTVESGSSLDSTDISLIIFGG